MAERSPAIGGEAGWLVSNELASLEQTYESGEVLGVPAHCLVGAEIDFSISTNNSSAEQLAALEAARAGITTELSLLVPKDEEQAKRRSAWLRQVPKLTPAELVNYQIYRRLSVVTLDASTAAMYLQADDSPETTLEFVFGKGLYQTGYYDNPGCYEMRTQAAKPTLAIERIQRAVTVAQEVAQAFGAHFSYGGSQLNFSVWGQSGDGLLQVHTLDTSEGQELARRATAGIFGALRDSMAVLRPPTALSDPRDRRLRLVAGPQRDPERGVTFRVLPDRFEHRITTALGRHALAIVILMSGFASGVTDPAVDTSFVRTETADLLVPGPGYDRVRDLPLLRALQESLVGGRFVFNSKYGIDTAWEEATLSSIIGADVQRGSDAAGATKKLLRCMSLSSSGELVVDEAAFKEVIREVSGHKIRVQSVPQDTIAERLQRITCLTGRAVVVGSIESERPSGVTMHRDLERFASAPSLRGISRRTREAVRREQAAAFMHEEAVGARYLAMIAKKRIPASAGAPYLAETLTQFPDANPEIVSQFIREDLRQTVQRLGELISEYGALSPIERSKCPAGECYESWRAQHSKTLALLQNLGG